MILSIPKETRAGEKRVALVPESVPKLLKAGLQVDVQSGAGSEAGFSDIHYREKGANLTLDAWAPPAQADLIAKIGSPSEEEASAFREGQILVCMLNPFNNLKVIKRLAERRVTSFALELIPRITRTQGMDVLSSMSSLAGYKAVLIAAFYLPKFFPLLMTAAGTIPPAKVLIIGAGVAGLQAIATARRLGARVEAYDTRPIVKEQVQSLGAKFVELPLEVQDAQTGGGYAKAQSKEFYGKQQELMGNHVKASDVVITTALVLGKRAPLLIPESVVREMRPGGVIVDLAAEQGGNCECTEPGKVVVKHGVTICGLLNLPSTMAYQASQLFSRNLTSFLLHMVKEGKPHFDLEDEVIRGPLVTHKGEIVNPLIQKALNPVSQS